MSIPVAEFPPDLIGVDAGATLCKVVRRAESLETLETRAFDSRDLDSVHRTILEWKAERVATTGGGAARLKAVAGAQVIRIPEFQAWAAGAPILADLEGIELPACYLLVSLGTGTSILLSEDGSSRRIGGSALGGGSLLGLGRLLLGVERFDEITELAARGDRRKVDLLVGDIYPDADELPLPADLNAASFAKLASREPADLAHALVGLLGENTALLCGQLAAAFQAKAILYCGSTLRDNPTLVEILTSVTEMMGARSHLLAHGASCGAVGAIAAAARA
jgi:type II pantothenate kinase